MPVLAWMSGFVLYIFCSFLYPLSRQQCWMDLGLGILLQLWRIIDWGARAKGYDIPKRGFLLL